MLHCHRQRRRLRGTVQVNCPSIQTAQEVEAPPPLPDQGEQLERERERESRKGGGGGGERGKWVEK